MNAPIAATLRALLRREAAIILPWIACFAATVIVGLVDDMLLDDRRPTGLLGLDEHGYERALIWCFWLLIGALVGAHDERHGTRAFLDTLPVSPRTRFMVRALACAVAVFVVAVIGEVATAWQILRYADRAADVDVAGPLAAIGVAVVTTGLRNLAAVSLGLLLAPLRQVTWLASFLVFIAIMISSDLAPAWQSIVPLFNGVPFEVADGVIFAWSGPALSLIVAILSFFFAILFAHRRRRPPVERSPRLAVAAVLGAVACGGLLWKLLWDRIPDPPTIVESQRVVFSLPRWESLNEDELARIDGDIAIIEARLGQALPGRLRADARGDLDHAHGKAHGLAIAFTRSAVHDRFVVVHEVTHAVASVIVGPDQAQLEMFNEGLANHVARRLATTTMPEHADPMARLVALAGERRLDDHLIWNASAAREVGGDALVYAIGEVFVDAMVDVYGDDAPARMLRALATTPTRGLTGIAVWHEVLARGGMMFEPIRARFFARVNAAKAAADLAQVPRRPIVTAGIEGDDLIVGGVDRQGEPLEDCWCLVRNHHFEDDARHLRRCRVPLSSLAGPTAEVRVSVGENVHSPWTRVVLPPH